MSRFKSCIEIEIQKTLYEVSLNVIELKIDCKEH